MRSAYADILRASVDGRDAALDPMERFSLQQGADQYHTETMADGTLSQLSRTAGLASGTGKAAYDGLIGTLQGIGTFVSASFGNEAARDKVGATTAGLVELLGQPDAWGVLLEHASKAQTLKMADAYERGDATALGEMSGQIIGALIDPAAAFKGVKLGGKGAELLSELQKIKKAEKIAEAEGIASALENNNSYRDGAAMSFPRELKTSSGIVITANPDKTTTVLGTFRDDTGRIINSELGLPESMAISGGTSPGSFNLLNVPKSYYEVLSPIQFWEKVNKPFIDAAIQRGDDIVLATKPDAKVPGLLTGRDGTLTGFGREIDYLKSRGYSYDPLTGMMKK